MQIIITIPDDAWALDVKALQVSIRSLVKSFWPRKKVEVKIDSHHRIG